MSVQNPVGLSMRDAAELVQMSSRFSSRISIRNKGGPADARSILGLLALGATHGAELELTFDGNDAGEARKAFKEFFEAGYKKMELKTS